MLAVFHEALGQPFGCPDLGSAELRRRLHDEEHTELLDALDSGDRVAIAHELADVVYVAYGTAHTLGIPLDDVIAEVHRANMSKFDADRRPVLREDGKVLKSDRFRPADVAGILGRNPVAPERGHAQRPPTVTLCGSMRFFPLMLEVAAAETAAGNIVLAPFSVVPTDEQGSAFKARLDELHRRKIDLADHVIVVTDQSGYYGDSTAGEIEYARERGVPVTFVVVDTPQPAEAHRVADDDLCRIEAEYVRAINAILAASAGSPDIERWRGQAEAYREVCEEIRRDRGLPAVDYRSEDWRRAHGVYTDEQVAEWRRQVGGGAEDGTGSTAASSDAYDAIQELMKRPGDPAGRLLAEAAQRVADLWNDPPRASWQRGRVHEVFPELADAVDELLGGGPNL